MFFLLMPIPKVNFVPVIRKGKKRDLAIYYLPNRYMNLSNRQIGEIFGTLSYSAVSKVYQRFLPSPSRKFILRTIGGIKFLKFDLQESLKGKRIIIQVTAVAII